MQHFPSEWQQKFLQKLCKRDFVTRLISNTFQCKRYISIATKLTGNSIMHVLGPFHRNDPTCLYHNF